MKRRGFLLIALICCFVFAGSILVACNGEDSDFTVSFDTQGGSNIAEITVGNGQVIGEVAPPAKQCARFIGFALDAGGERMWNLQTDTVSADITLYAIWEDAHTWGEWADTTPATCTEDGERTRECEVCGKTESEAINALGHDYEEEYTEDIAPTCENPGSESRHCIRCDATTDSREINALGHTWGEWAETRAPGCETEGEKEHSCAVCGKKEKEAIDALGHNTDGAEWKHDSESHWKICKRCDKEAEKSAHYFGTTGICVCGVIGETPASEFIFSSLGNNEWEVTKYTGTRLVVLIPSVHQDGAVTSIGNSAFGYCTGLTSVIIPDSVTSIGDYAFSGCTGLTSVTIGAGVTSIGDYAFYNCSGLTSVTIGDSVTSIGSHAFSGCSGLKSITIPFVGAEAGKTSGDTYQYPFGYIFGTTSYTGGTEVKQYYYGSSTSRATNSTYYIPSSLREVTVTGGNILYGAFYDCSGLTSVTIGDGVISIGDEALRYCTDLTSVTIGDGVTSIGRYAFYDCSGSMSIYYTGDIAGWCRISRLGAVMPSGRTLYIDGSKVEGAITIPDGVTSIGGYAFYNCSGLTSITIPDSVTSIGDYAFDYCYKLVEVYNKSLLSITAGSSSNGNIGYYAKNVYTSEGGSWLTDTSDGYRFLYDGTNGYLMGYYGDQTELTLPDSFTAYNGTEITEYGIYDYAFYHCRGLTSVTIPDGVTSIGDYAFEGCTNLIQKENGVSYVDKWVIDCDSSAGEVTLRNDTVGIGNRAFYNCRGLTSVTIPDSVTSIGNSAFEDCTGLTSVIIGNGVTSIGDAAFHRCYGLTSVTIGDSVTSIGDEAFAYCTGMTSITIPDSVISIGDWAFAYCSVTSVTIGDGVQSIGDYAFRSCTGLTSIYYTGDIAGWCGISGLDEVMSSRRTLYIDGSKVEGAIAIPDSVTSIPSYAFAYQTGITSVTIPDSVTSIGDDAFYDCYGLTSVTIGDGVQSIGDYAFRSCTGLTSIYYTGDITGWLNISGLANLTSHISSECKLFLDGTIIGGDIIIPDGVESIPSYAFAYQTGITSVTIPDSVTSIGDDAFYDCYGLTSVTIGDGVQSIGDYAFRSCTGLTSVYISDIAAWCGIAFGGSHANPLSYANNLYLNGELVTDLVIPDSVTSIGDYAFYDCTGLTSVTIGNSVTSIGSFAFRECSGLTSVTIGEGVTSIGDDAFYGCSRLTSVTFEKTSGWFVSTSSLATSGTNISASRLSDKSTAASYLKSTYYNYYWKRNA